MDKHSTVYSNSNLESGFETMIFTMFQLFPINYDQIEINLHSVFYKFQLCGNKVLKQRSLSLI